MSLIETLDPVLQPWAQRLFDVAESAGVRPRVTSGRRSTATQEQLYKAFLAGHSHYPAAPPGFSAHEYGLAFDMVVTGSVNQSDLGVVWRSWGGRYGGEEDPIHFQYPGFSPTAAKDQAAQGTPSPANIESRVLELADAIVQLVPSPVRGILSTVRVASWIYAIAGGQYALGIEWILDHPAEVTQAFVQAVRLALFGK